MVNFVHTNACVSSEVFSVEIYAFNDKIITKLTN